MAWCFWRCYMAQASKFGGPPIPAKWGSFNVKSLRDSIEIEEEASIAASGCYNVHHVHDMLIMIVIPGHIDLFPTEKTVCRVAFEACVAYPVNAAALKPIAK